MQEKVTLSNGEEFIKIITEPKVSNIVTVTYLAEKIINTEAVFKYIPIEYIKEAEEKKYKKNIPTFERYDVILSARFRDLARGVRKAKKQMEQICSMDVSLYDDDPQNRKSVHCKLAGDTCHVTGAKSFEQGMRATKIIITAVQNTQKLIDDYRLGRIDNNVFYNLYKGERTKEEVDLLCEDLMESSEMLCERSIQVKLAVTSNGVYEIKANFKFFLKTLCEIAHHKENFCVDYANWIKSTIASISIPGSDGDKKFYHRAQINSKGAIRLSSPCDTTCAMKGYAKLCKLLFRVWDETRLIFEKHLKLIEKEEIDKRYTIEEDFEEFWKDFSKTSIAEISGDTDNEMVYEKAIAVYSKLGILL